MTIEIKGTSKKTESKALWLVNDTIREVVAFCPKCKAMETINFNGPEIVPTRRYTQIKGNVYHVCGSTIPCRLYSLS
jgi:hypothetical protein